MSQKANIFTGTVGVVVLLAVIVVVNLIVGQVHGLRVDMTEEQLYTLSEGSEQLVSELDRPVQLKFFYTSSSEQMPVTMKRYAQRIEDLLQEFSSAGEGQVSLEVFDPKPDSDAEEWALKYGVAGQMTGIIGGDPVYMGLVAVSGVKEAVIPFIQPQMEPQLEYLVSRLVQEVTRDKKPVIGIMSSFQVMGSPPPMFGMPQQNRQEQWLIVQELEQFYEVETIPLDTTAIPAEVDVVMLIHPRGIAPSALYALDQFVLSGGRLVAFLDAVSMTERFQNPQMAQMAFAQGGSELNMLTSAWGLHFTHQKLLGDPNAVSQLSDGRGGVQPSVNWLTARPTMFNEDEIAMSGLDVLSIPFGGIFTGAPPEGVEMTPLITTSPEAGLVDQFVLMGGPSTVMSELEPAGTNLLLAVRLSGMFKTAFENGPPADEETEGLDPAGGLKESAEPGTVILVGDADLLFDQFAVQVIPFFGQRYAQPINDNFNFALNLMEQVTGTDALMSLRTRGTFRRPFEKVLALEKEAREKYYEEEQALQEKVREIQLRLNELQSAKQGDQQFILSPEQKAEVDRFREEEIRFQRQLKEVRKNLRMEVEQLGYKVKAFNMAALPLLVALFGIARGLNRRRRSARG